MGNAKRRPPRALVDWVLGFWHPQQPNNKQAVRNGYSNPSCTLQGSVK